MVSVRRTDVEPITEQYAGIYSLSEVASYLLVTMPAEQHPPTRRRILRWIRHGLVAPERHSQSGRDVVLDFGDLVTCQAITILGEAGFGLSDIVEAERYFAERLGIARPFAHRTFWHSGRDGSWQLRGRLVSDNKAGQIAGEFLARWLTAQTLHLGFAEGSGKADSWRPVERISLKPAIQFGQPCIDGTRIPTSSIWSYIRAGDPPPFIADAYGVDIADVEQAVRWEEWRRAELDASAAVPAR
jgi:uncharacterized protein (DUF433 family)